MRTLRVTGADFESVWQAMLATGDAPLEHDDRPVALRLRSSAASSGSAGVHALVKLVGSGVDIGQGALAIQPPWEPQSHSKSSVATLPSEIAIELSVQGTSVGVLRGIGVVEWGEK